MFKPLLYVGGGASRIGRGQLTSLHCRMCFMQFLPLLASKMTGKPPKTANSLYIGRYMKVPM
jgi:hypothetical protein